MFEAAEHGDLLDFLKEVGSLPESICRFYFKSVLTTLSHIHQRGVFHRDLKPENFLVDSDFNLILADFGLAWLHECDTE